MKGVGPIRTGGRVACAQRARAEDVAGLIHPGSSVFIETGCAEPSHLVKALIMKNYHLSDVQVFTTIPLAAYPDFGGPTGDRFRIHSFFISPGLTGPFSMGKADHIPLTSESLERMIQEGVITINTALIQVSPPDEDGTVSLGVSVDVVRSVIEKAHVVIAQMNANMPFTYGDSLIDISDIDFIVEHDEPLLCYGPEEHDFETKEIGTHVARLVPDGATIQVGFGRIPDAAVRAMGSKKNLSVHSEIITDAVMELIKAGIVSPRTPVKAAMCVGTQELFRFVHKNPCIEMTSLARLADPREILGRGCFVAINGAVEIDLTGQSCMMLDERGSYMGALGHPHFNRIAQLSRGGKAVIALRSTSRDASMSRIVPKFTSTRMGVFTTQTDVQYVVTEYGSANLFGKSIRERALELITIAHPKYRQWLLQEAKHLNYVYPDQIMPPPEANYPYQFEHVQFFGGREVFFRPVRITDERAVQNLFYSLSADDRFHRFLLRITSLHHNQAQKMVNCDYRESIAMVAEVGPEGSREIVAIAHICRDNSEENGDGVRICEFAAMVNPCWQNMGIGTYLLRTMVEIARLLGFAVLRAHVWEENARMIAVLSKLGLHMSATVDCQVIRLDFDLASAHDRSNDLLPELDVRRNDTLRPFKPLLFT